MAEKKSKKKSTKKNTQQTETPTVSVIGMEIEQSESGVITVKPQLPKHQTVLVMADGTEHTVVSESGRYYHTIDGDFRKVNPNIKTVKKVALNSN